MTFASITSRSGEYNSNFRKTNFWKKSIGTHYVRILDESAEEVFTHWVNGTSFKCPGEECPICENNRKIMAENPESFRRNPGFNPYQRRWNVNILDRTLVKVCENKECETKIPADANGAFPTVCPSCGMLLPDKAEPNNEISILSGGKTLFINELEAYAKAYRDEEGNPIPINSYDMALIVSKGDRGLMVKAAPMTGRNSRIVVSDVEGIEDAYVIHPDELYDTKTAVLELTAPEILKLISGVELRDIFAERRSQAEASEITTHSDVESETESVKADSSEVINSINSIFG